MKTVVLSGIRPTGILHLGNYLGALRYFVELASDPDKLCLFFIANMHGQTTGATLAAAEEMKKDILGIVVDFIAAGLNPEAGNVLIYAQSSIPETAELTWILNCVTPVNELMGMHHFADKRDKLATADGANSGLLTYPVLMAADILGPKAKLVPVGADQHQHVELARRTARRFNERYETDFFEEPKLLEGPGVRVPGLKGQGKMGKSEPKGTINLSDPPDVIAKKVRSTDKRLPDNASTGEVSVEPRVADDPGNPEICRVFQLHALMAPSAEQELAIQSGCRDGSLRCGDCKNQLASSVQHLLAPIQARRADLVARGGDRLALEILHEHGKRARAIIAPTVEQVKFITGVPNY